MLEEISSQVEAPVFGLQCVKDAPALAIEKLAAFYKEVSTFT